MLTVLYAAEKLEAMERRTSAVAEFRFCFCFFSVGSWTSCDTVLGDTSSEYELEPSVEVTDDAGISLYQIWGCNTLFQWH